MSREQRLIGYVLSLAMIGTGALLFFVSIGTIVSLLRAEDAVLTPVAVANTRTAPPLSSFTATPTLVPTTTTPAGSVSPVPATATPSSTATAPVGATVPSPSPESATATPSPVPPSATSASVPPSATGIPASPIPPTLTTVPASLTATVQPSATIVPTVAAPPLLTLQTAPLSPEVSVATSRCAALDSATTAGLFQAQSPAPIGTMQTLCLGGFPIGEPVSVSLTGRTTQTVVLSDEDGNGFGYGTVTYIPTRGDRTTPVNMIATTSAVTAQGQVIVNSIVPASAIAPVTGDVNTVFYAVFAFPDATPRDLYLYRRVNDAQFELVRQILVIPQPDNCATLAPCFAADIAFSREVAGEYRLVEYAPASGFRLFPSDVAPLGFVITAITVPSSPVPPSPEPSPTIESSVTPIITATETATVTPEVVPPVTETPLVLPTPSTTLPPTETPSALPATPIPTTTVVIT